MSKFDKMWDFANRHPFIFSGMVGTAVSGCVKIVQALTKPFVKVPDTAATINLSDIIGQTCKALEKTTQESAGEETEEMVEASTEVSARCIGFNSTDIGSDIEG